MLSINQTEIQKLNYEQVAGVILTIMQAIDRKEYTPTYYQGSIESIVYFELSPIWLGKNVRNGVEFGQNYITSYAGDTPPTTLRSLSDEATELLRREGLIKQDPTQTSPAFMVLTDTGKNMIIDDLFNLYIQRDPTQLIEKYKRSVLLMETKADGDISCGTCFYIGKGTFITCQHNIEGRTFVIHFDKDTILSHENFEISSHSIRDVAILRIKSSMFRTMLNHLTPFDLGKSDGLKMGNQLITLGYPLMAQRLTDLVADIGTFQNYTRNYQEDQIFITFSNKVGGGCSGGPVISYYGKVVGIITELTEQSTGSGGAEMTRGVPYYHGTPIELAIEML